MTERMRAVGWCHTLGSVVLLLLLTLPSGSAQPDTVLPVLWNPRFQLPSLQDLRERLQRPFDAPLVVQRNHQTASIANCADWLNETRRGFRAMHDRELRRWQFLGADCRALDLLRSARPARRSALGENVLDPRFLPPNVSFLPSPEERKRAGVEQSKGLSWQDSEPDLKVTSRSPDQVAVETAAGYVRIEWCARGDFNADGMEDLLVRVNSYARQGTYASTRLFLLTRSAPDKVLRVLQELD